MTEIIVIDALMGQGKTTYMFDLMREHPEEKYLYIGISLDEAARCKAACPSLDMKDPVPYHGRKYWSLSNLIRDGENVASTHQLFRLLEAGLSERIKEQGYTLIIDEALDVVSQYPINKVDLEMLFRDGKLFVEESSHCLRWNHQDYPNYRGKYGELVPLCDNGNLVSTREGILLWTFPVAFLDAFKRVYVCTYLFEGQVMADYLKANGVPYALKTLRDGELADYAAVDNRGLKEKLAAFVRIVADDRLNAVGAARDRGNPLSASWYLDRRKAAASKQMRAELSQVRRNLEHFYRRMMRAKSAETMWTTFKEHRALLRGRGYTGGFVPLNAKATDKFKNRSVCAYLVNRFQSPLVRAYFEDMQVPIREDLFALTELIQWLWRSRIRKNPPEEITLYIPSERMRLILLNWIGHSDAEIVAGQRLDGKGLVGDLALAV